MRTVPQRHMYLKTRPPVGALWNHEEVAPCWRKYITGMGFEGLLNWSHFLFLSVSFVCDGMRSLCFLNGRPASCSCCPHMNGLVSLWNVSQNKPFISPKLLFISLFSDSRNVTNTISPLKRRPSLCVGGDFFFFPGLMPWLKCLTQIFSFFYQTPVF